MQYFINLYDLLDGKTHLDLKPQLSAISLYFEKKKQRQQLLQLEDYLLDDMGISRQQAVDEAKK
jgi:hypothetical protein